MRKLLAKLFVIWLVAGGVTIVVTWVVHQVNPNLIQNPEVFWLSFWQTTASVGAVVMALYGDDIKSGLHMPNIIFTMSPKVPLTCVVGENRPKASDDKSKVAEIYGEIQNTSGVTARNCQIVTDVILASTGEKDYTIKYDFCQTPFMYINDYDRVGEADLPQAIKRHIKVAVLAESTNSSSLNKDEEPLGSRPVTLRIALADRTRADSYIHIDKRLKHILIPICIVSSNCETQRKVIHIHWGGEKLDEYTDSTLFSVEVLEVKKVIPLLAESVDKKRIGAN